jgi:ABC-type sugar transport system permease subunit
LKESNATTEPEYQAASPSRPAEKPRRSLQRYEARVGLLFLLPWILGFILLKGLPILASLGFSFTDFNMLAPQDIHFTGLHNYARLVKDNYAITSMVASLGMFLVVVPLEIAMALGLAALVTSKRLRGRRLIRLLIFVPCIIPSIAFFFIYQGFADPRTGWLSLLILQPLGLPPDSAQFFPLFLLMLWNIGPSFLILLGAMLGVPQELYEAGRVDGAGPFTRFFSITVPLISPAIFFSLVIYLTSAFGGAVLLDRGTAFSDNAAPMLSYITYTMFSNRELGYASTLAWMMFLVVMALVILLFNSARRWVYFPEESRDADY